MDLDIQVIGGDIASVEADALITAINSEGAWFGGIDGVIQRSAGNMFHTQAASRELTDGVAFGTVSLRSHPGFFRNVVFVVDDLRQPLRNIVKAGLNEADDMGCKTVTLPTIRMGVMLGVVEKGRFEAIHEMVEGIRAFEANGYNHLEKITFVVYNDPSTEALLRKELGI